MRQMSGHCDFALPYWDYVADGFLPDPLRLPADGTNPLYNDTRAAALNAGTAGLSGMHLGSLDETAFASFSSLLYGNPHSAVHGQVGGNMGSVPTAARDPVFYLHHCNIDRYWECWSRKGGTNPGAPWPGQAFPFRTLSGHRDARAGDVGRTGDVGYTYDSLPCAPPIHPDLLDWLRRLRYLRLRVRPRPIPGPDPWPWRAVFTTEPFTITGQPLAVVLSQGELQKAGMPAALGGADGTVAVTLHGVEMSKAARAGGFFVDAWVAPVAALRSGDTRNALRIGSFSSFDLSVHAGHTGHDAAARASVPSPIAMPLGERAMRLIAGAKDDLAIIFVRQGLVDRKGQPVDDQGQATLFQVEGMGLEVAAATR
ncbi:MAG: tyrosinase family protein [Luteimonas sp.]|nr:tyrosinase family protein [Luteimonas sp.]